MLYTNHRTDIDGLRALAVISVIIYHLNANWLTGGFVGVDIFFVISGFVITSQILKLNQHNTFTLLSFYERRCRRILPAIYFMLVVTSLFAFFTLYPNDYRSFFSAAKKVFFLLPNYYFAKNVNYFDAATDSSPLLHTWSLGVEEQLYLIYPAIFIFCLRKFPLRINAILMMSVLIASLLYSQHLLTISPSLSFYMPYSRAWEFLIGGFLALDVLPKIYHSKTNIIVSLVGVAILFYSLCFFNQLTPFPGFNSLYPCIGTALIIYTGNYTYNTIHQILSFKPVTFVGTISYSLYLWHWPLIAFYSLISHTTPNFLTAVVIFILTFCFAYLSWRHIEQPFRNIPLSQFKLLNKFTARSNINIDSLQKIQIILTAFTITAVMLTSIRFMGTFYDSPWRLYKADSVSIADKEQFNSFIITPDDYQGILFGDSHATHYYNAVSTWAENHDIEIKLFSYPGCPSLFGEFPLAGNEKRNQECKEHLAAAEEIIRTDPKIKFVILASRYDYYTNNPERREAFEKQFRYTIKELQKLNKQIVILDQVPIFQSSPYITTYWDKIFRTKNQSDGFDHIDYDFYGAKLSFTNKLFKDILLENDIDYFEPSKFIKSSECHGKSLFYDENHLSVAGSRFIAHEMNFPLLEKKLLD